MTKAEMTYRGLVYFLIAWLMLLALIRCEKSERIDFRAATQSELIRELVHPTIKSVDAQREIESILVSQRTWMIMTPTEIEAFSAQFYLAAEYNINDYPNSEITYTESDQAEGIDFTDCGGYFNGGFEGTGYIWDGEKSYLSMYIDYGSTIYWVLMAADGETYVYIKSLPQALLGTTATVNPSSFHFQFDAPNTVNTLTTFYNPPMSVDWFDLTLEENQSLVDELRFVISGNGDDFTYQQDNTDADFGKFSFCSSSQTTEQGDCQWQQPCTFATFNFHVVGLINEALTDSIVHCATTRVNGGQLVPSGKCGECE